MAMRWSGWGWSLLVAMAVFGAAWEIFADRGDQDTKAKPKPVAVETLLPADTVVYLRHEGLKAHSEAWQQTAAFEALSAARVEMLLDKFMSFLQQQAPGTFDPRMESLARHLANYGGSLAISVPASAPLPRVTFVLHRAAKHAELISELKVLLDQNRIASESATMEGREISIAHLSKTPAIDLAWWSESEHLVITAGVDPVRKTLEIAKGDAENITQHRLWNTSTDQDHTVLSTAWVDAKSLRRSFEGFPIPIPDAKPLTVRNALEILGLDTLDELVLRTGFEGKALWSETVLRHDGERSGLLKMTEGEPITFEDLPPLPKNCRHLLAASVKPAETYRALREMIRESLAYGPEDVQQQVEGTIDAIPGFLGFDPETDLLGTLGPVVVVCNDPNQGLLGTGGTLLVQVKDAKKLRQTFENIFSRLDNMIPNEEFRVHRTEKLGRQIWNLEIGHMLQGLGIVVDDNWFAMALMPQSIEAFLLRLEDKLPRLKKEELIAAGAIGLTDRFTSLGVSDPQFIYQNLLKAAPFGMSALITTLKEEGTLPRNANFPWTLADLPPAELIAGPLFPNVLTKTASDSEIRWTSRSSLPSVPVLSGPGGGNSAVVGSVVTGLILPAIQQARAANRRVASKNNLKQLGIAMHNYHETFNYFPAGTVLNEKLKPDERLSFFVALLPNLDQKSLYESIETDAGWMDKVHREILQTEVPLFINPAAVEVTSPESNSKEIETDYAKTHYVGITGVGKNSALLPVGNPKAGIFGYNRKTRIRDVTDGVSNTVMISEASNKYGPWSAGGNATLRGFTKKPYINGPDGIGGPFPGGCQMLLGDGAVRFISQNIDAKILEGLSTIAGGEVIGNF